MECGGILMLLHFVGSNLLAVGRWIKGLGKTAESPGSITKADLDAKFKELQASNETMIQEQFEKMNRGVKNEAPLEPQDVEDRLEASFDGVSSEVSASSIQDGLDSFGESLGDLASMQGRMSAEAVRAFDSTAVKYESLSKNFDKLRNDFADGKIGQSELNAGLDGLKNDVSAFKSEFDTMYEDVRSSVEGDLASQLKESQESFEDFEETEEQIKENEEADETGDDLEGDDIGELPFE
jgi:hypothetical protein